MPLVMVAVWVAALLLAGCSRQGATVACDAGGEQTTAHGYVEQTVYADNFREFSSVWVRLPSGAIRHMEGPCVVVWD